MSRELRDLIAEDVVVEDLGFHAVKGWPDSMPAFGLIALNADSKTGDLSIDLPRFNNSFLALNISLKNLIGN